MLTACAGRQAAPVAVTNSFDTDKTCTQLRAEIDANNTRITELRNEEENKRAQNIVAGTAGALFLFPLLFMDFQDAAGQERRSLESRNQYLAQLTARDCSTVVDAPSTAPERAPAAAATPVAGPMDSNVFASAADRDAYYDQQARNAQTTAQSKVEDVSARCSAADADKEQCRLDLVEIGKERAAALEKIEADRAAATIKTS
mgnify:FL=1